MRSKWRWREVPEATARVPLSGIRDVPMTLEITELPAGGGKVLEYGEAKALLDEDSPDLDEFTWRLMLHVLRLAENGDSDEDLIGYLKYRKRCAAKEDKPKVRAVIEAMETNRWGLREALERVREGARVPPKGSVPKWIREQVEEVLRSYHADRALVDEYEQARQDVIQAGGRPDGPIPGNPTGWHSPVEHKAVTLETLNRRYRRYLWRVKAVEAALDDMSPEERRVVELRYFAGATWAQVESKMHKAKQNLNPVLWRALWKVARRLDLP